MQPAVLENRQVLFDEDKLRPLVLVAPVLSGGAVGETWASHVCASQSRPEHERKPRGQGPCWNSILPIAVLFLFRGGVIAKSS